MSSSRLLTFAVLPLVVVVACAPSKPADAPNIAFEPLPGASSRSPTTEKVQELAFAKELPKGFTPSKSKGAPPEAHPGYPSPDDPHLVLGRLRVLASAEKRDPEKRLTVEDVEQYQRLRDDVLAKTAAEHGANAFWVADDGNVWALHVSAAPPVPGERVDVLLKQIVPADVRELKRATFSLEAEPRASFKIAAQRGHCYGVALALAPTAGLTPQAALGIDWTQKWPANAPALRDGRRLLTLELSELDGVNERAHDYGKLTCAFVDEPLTFQLSKGTATRDALGRGELTVVLYERSSMTDMIETACGQCQPALVGCGTSTPAAACAPFHNCLASAKLSAAPCGD